MDQCQGRLRFMGHCERRPTVVRDGKHYCWQHDPVRLQEIALEQRRQSAERTRKIEEKHDTCIQRRRLEEDSGVSSLTNEDLEKIIQMGGMSKILNNHNPQE